MNFSWPNIKGKENKKFYRCSATMISPQVAVTAANCVRYYEVGITPYDMRVKIGR